MSYVHQSLVYKETPQGLLVITPYLPDDWSESDLRVGVAFFFGGGWVSGTPTQFAHHAHALADLGMVCFCVDYRTMSRHAVLAPTCVEDGKSAIRWLRQHCRELGLDPNRLVAAGGSAGGHVAACAGIIPGYEDPSEDLTISSAPNALVLFNPVLDASHDQTLAARFGDLAIAERLAPLRHIRPGLPPTWLTHGTDDEVIPFRQARQFRAQRLAAGNHVALLEATGERHGFYNAPAWRQRTLDNLQLFFAGLGYLQRGNRGAVPG